ncbi:biotin/lipoyl-binding protein [Hydrogenimonas thermophila]|uniref:efflux RND transporter periplasmic adaptor subunit n=1 Tax=Hydrogenimonas thermophila TaxID=223786 RepID=UPI0029370F84|nr:biotin/lipoyl-binding protein [Hydrogenimonas thermophila]WOE70840.1 biotin/lipoyl-binding protein [Hydrogenimonas thermophila]WOE73358.1 biotin/lipoyl-binding protein [Hydrogenimonas thermophila]
MKKVVGFIIVVLLVAGSIVVLKKKKEQLANLPTPAAKSVTVETAMPKVKSIEEKRSFIGRYYSVDHPVIASKISGFIQKIYVEEGDRVKKGDLLVSIDDKELQSAVKAQKASIKALNSAIESLKFSLKALESDYLQTKSVYERNLKLYKADALAKEKLDLSKVAMELKESKYITTKNSIEAKQEELKALKAQLDSKINQLRYASIKALNDGTVGKIFLRVGDLAMPGKPIVKLLGDKKRVEFQFPLVKESIKKGMKVYVNGVESKISEILPESEKALGIARVDLKGKLALPENSNISVEVVTRSAKGTAVPVTALLEKVDGNEKERYVFVYNQSEFTPKKVKVLASDGSYAVIDSEITQPVAVGSNDKLSRLFVLKSVKVVNNE